MRFDELGLDPDILQSLEAMNFHEMTPVQEAAIPIILQNNDLIGCAQTGTGKTAAYILPLLDKLIREPNTDNVVRSLIVVPTRELAMQIDVQLQGFSYFLPLSATVVYGGGDGIGWEQQKQGMLRGSDIVVATPGRLLAHMANSGIDLSHVEYFVLDEADRMLDMGFHDDIMKIIEALTKQRQTLLFSATLPPKIRELAKQILHNPSEVTIAVSKPNEAIQQEAYICYEAQKLDLIRALFDKPLDSKTIIFASSKQKVKELTYMLKRMKLNAAAMHSDLDQNQREEVMLAFKNGKIDLLVATDIVARGIDIEDIGTVVNYDVPYDPEDYIHRIGRTARASATGRAITFVNEKEQGKFHRIELFMEREVEKLPLPAPLGEGPAYHPDMDKRRNNREGRGVNRRRSGRGGGRNDRGSKERRNNRRPKTDATAERVAGSSATDQPTGQKDHQDRGDDTTSQRSGFSPRRTTQQSGTSAEHADKATQSPSGYNANTTASSAQPVSGTPFENIEDRSSNRNRNRHRHRRGYPRSKQQSQQRSQSGAEAKESATGHSASPGTTTQQTHESNN